MRKRQSLVVCLTAVLCVVFLSVPSTSQATTLVKAIQYTLYGGDCFYKPGDTYSGGEFFLYEDNYSVNPTGVIGQFMLDGDSGYNYEIRGGAIELTSSPLLQDTSYATSYPINTFNPYIARGLFGGGAVITISGYITTAGGTEVLSDYGTLIEATVNANFYGLEQTYSPNFLGIQLHFDITGGELFTGEQTGFALSPEFVTDITLRYCTQFDQTALKDFSSDIGYAQPSIIQINAIGTEPVPEPASLVVFGLAALFIKRYK